MLSSKEEGIDDMKKMGMRKGITEFEGAIYISRLRASFYLLSTTMSPNRVRSRQDAIQQEGRILLAIQAIKNKEIGSIRQAAEQF
ncbi:unnamed protein product [Penicillium pancosmium]